MSQISSAGTPQKHEKEERSEKSEKSEKVEEELIGRLIAGNARYVKGLRRPANYKKERAGLLTEQSPYAIILSCSDSRVPPEIIFDESLGKLFVIRVAGNVVDPVTLGSVEFAVEQLHTKLIFVLGHESCGAVQATVEGGQYTYGVEAILAKIKPAVGSVRRKHPDAKDIARFVVEENVELQANNILAQSERLRELMEENELFMATGIYNVVSGKVSFSKKEFSEEEERQRR